MRCYPASRQGEAVEVFGATTVADPYRWMEGPRFTRSRRVGGLDGTPEGDIPLPGVGAVSALESRADAADVWFGFSSPLMPATGGRLWATEYGSAAEPAQFLYLIQYSPLHNLKAGTCYPATLVTAADHDDRVVPSHSFKFTAALQAAQGGDQWAFAAEHLGLRLKSSAFPASG